MHSGVQQIDSTVNELRARLRKMSDPELLRYGLAAKYMCSPEANMGKPPRLCFVQQLEIAREIWLERHPKLQVNGSMID